MNNGQPPPLQNYTSAIGTADGKQLIAQGAFRTVITAKGIRIPVQFVVIDNLTDIILGNDVLNVCNVDGWNHSFQYKGGAPIPLINKQYASATVKLINKETISPRSELTLR